MAFAASVISCTARYAKSISLSGCPTTNAAVVSVCPVSVPATAQPAATAVARSRYPTLPAHAPLPTDSSLVFQFDSGSHTSILMSESLVGFKVAATRQIAGRFPKLGGGTPGNAGTAPAGRVSCPAGTACASVMVACGRASLARLSHGVAAAMDDESAMTRTKYRICSLYLRTALR